MPRLQPLQINIQVRATMRAHTSTREDTLYHDIAHNSQQQRPEEVKRGG